MRNDCSGWKIVFPYFLVKFWLNVPFSIHDFLTVVQDPWQDHRRMRTNWFSVLNTQIVCFCSMSLFLATNPQLSLCTWHILWYFTSHGTSLIVAVHVLWHSSIIAFHVLWYFMPHVNQDLHRKILNFTHEYLRVSMHEVSHMCKVIVELYCSILNTIILKD